MNSQQPVKYKPAYKWLSYCLVFGFVYYWLFTLGVAFFSKSINRVTPRQVTLYNAFCKQKWHLFAITNIYNRQLNFIVRDKLDPLKTDTLDLVQYSIANKKSNAPFNDYYYAFDQLLYWMMNDVEVALWKKGKIMKKQFPGMPDSFYMRQSNALLLSDSLHPMPLQNLENYGKYVLRQLKKDTAGKEFQLILVHKFIPPQYPLAGSVFSGDEQISFISSFKSF